MHAPHTMSRRESMVDKISGYIDTEFSSGDSNKMKSKQIYQEENNNEVDELSKDLSEMGCIVDAMKRPPNICVETCVYEESDSDNSKVSNVNEEDTYSDEFEDDKSEGENEEQSVRTESKSETSDKTSRGQTNQSSIKLSKSQSSVSSNKPPSVSVRSSGYGSVSVPPTRRVNMSFTNERLREIERHNHILLNKILSARNSRKSSIPPREQPKKPIPSAAVHRRVQQRQIDHDNMILLKKIQRAKSSAYSIRR